MFNCSVKVILVIGRSNALRPRIRGTDDIKLQHSLVRKGERHPVTSVLLGQYRAGRHECEGNMGRVMENPTSWLLVWTGRMLGGAQRGLRLELASCQCDS